MFIMRVKNPSSVNKLDYLQRRQSNKCKRLLDFQFKSDYPIETDASGYWTNNLSDQPIETDASGYWTNNLSDHPVTHALALYLAFTLFKVTRHRFFGVGSCDIGEH